MKRARRLGLVLAAIEIVFLATPLVVPQALPIVGTIAFGAILVLTVVAFSRGPWAARLVPLAIAGGLVAAWTTFRALVMHDHDVVFLALVVHGVVVFFVGLVGVMAFLEQRGWITYSPAKRRVLFSAFLLNALLAFTGAPSGPWHTPTRLAVDASIVALIFWPVRRSQPGEPVRAV